MQIRTLLPLTLAVVALAIAAACGGDDSDSSSTPTAITGASTGASGTPTPLPGTPTITPTPVITIGPILTPSRSLPAADHTGIGVYDAIVFNDPHIRLGELKTTPCEDLDFATGIIDCTAAGFGTIAIDPIPPGTGVWTCRAIEDAANVFFSASCSGTSPEGIANAYIYAIDN